MSVMFAASMAGTPSYIFTPIGIVEEWLDGDTVVAHVISLPGMGLYGQHIRVAEINTPEKNSKNAEERSRAMAALVRAGELLPPGATFKMKTTKREKYGRLLAKIELPDGRDFGSVMIEEGFAEPLSYLKFN